MDETRTICFCHNVPLETLLREIRAGALTLEEVQRRTKASTGCGGCESEVLEILQAEAERLAGQAADPVSSGKPAK